jgi:hypothetical protein
MKNKPLRGRLGRWWETLSGYHLDIVYQTSKTNSVDCPSHRPDYKAAAKAEDHWKQAEERTGGSQECAQSSEGESEEGRNEVARISTAQLLRP